MIAQLQVDSGFLINRFEGVMARDGSGAMARGSRERWHVDKVGCPQLADAGAIARAMRLPAAIDDLGQPLTQRAGNCGRVRPECER
jgi:hypothetical protein